MCSQQPLFTRCTSHWGVARLTAKVRFRRDLWLWAGQKFSVRQGGNDTPWGGCLGPRQTPGGAASRSGKKGKGCVGEVGLGRGTRDEGKEGGMVSGAAAVGRWKEEWSPEIDLSHRTSRETESN